MRFKTSPVSASAALRPAATSTMEATKSAGVTGSGAAPPAARRRRAAREGDQGEKQRGSTDSPHESSFSRDPDAA